ncbi:MAG TPA: magnesium transporter [Candidatus Limnocylindria bacterium]|nr:magnesium transporter [Candidatus Limnocylindria bacterium]
MSATDASQTLTGEFIRLYPDQVAHILEELPPAETARLIEATAPANASGLLERLNPRVAAGVLAELGDDATRAALKTMIPTKAAPILASLDNAARERMLALVDPRLAEHFRELLTYPADTAGALMDPRITAFDAELTVEEALRRMRSFKEKELGAIYLMDRDGKLSGSVPLGELVTAQPETKLQDIVRGTPATVAVTATREEIVESLASQRLATFPVVDLNNRLVGVIRYRALLAAAEAEASSDIQTMVGASRDETALSRVGFSVRRRLPWLEINLATAFLAASVVGLFQGTIEKYAALAVLMPVVAGQSGNSGMQALAVTMRGVILREVGLRDWPKLVWKEARVGILNGLGVSLVTMIAVFLWSRSPGLTLVIGVAMVLAMIVASVCGALVPLALKAFGQDPAQSSSIILTTFTDCGGFLSFLGLATLLSGLLTDLRP